MEVYFLDVGQGTSQLILLGNQRAIVVDSGDDRGNVLLNALTRYRVEHILLFILTHSHIDHSGGATKILANYAGRMDQLWFLDDPGLKTSKFWQRLWQLVEEGEVDASQFYRIECTSEPREMFRDDSQQLIVRIHSPRFAENLSAGEPNATSAIISLDVGPHRVVFGADSVLEQWKRIASELGRPLACNILAVPHHGGDIHGNNLTELEWLYRNAIRPEVAVISVGTSNNYGHPNRNVVSVLRRTGAKVMCTQVTSQCCNDVEVLRPGVQWPLESIRLSSLKEDRTRGGSSRNVACAGTVVVEVTESEVSVLRLDAHQRGVDAMNASGPNCPLCRQN